MKWYSNWKALILCPHSNSLNPEAYSMKSQTYNKRIGYKDLKSSSKTLHLIYVLKQARQLLFITMQQGTHQKFKE